MADPVVNQTTDNQTPDFISMLSPEMQSHPSAVKFKGKGAGDVFQAYTNLESLVNKKQEGMVRIPGADASDDDRLAFHKALGVPEKPDAYGLPDFSDLHESLPGGKDWKPHAGMDQWFRQQAHELGLTPAQFQKLYKSQIAFTIAEQKNISEGLKQHTQKMFGDKYDDAVKAANRALSRMPAEQQKQFADDIGNDPKITMLLYSFGQNLGESQSPDGAGAPMSGVQAIEELKKKREEIRNTKEYRNGTTKTPAVIEVDKLTQQIIALEKNMGIKK